MATEWYYRINGKDVGPVPPSALRQLANDGVVSHETPVRRAPDANWTTAQHVRGLFPETAQTAVAVKSGEQADGARASEGEVAESVATNKRLGHAGLPPIPNSEFAEQPATIQHSCPTQRSVQPPDLSYRQHIPPVWVWLVFGSGTLLIIVLAILAFRAGGGRTVDAAITVISGQDSEPTYEGKPLSQWVAQTKDKSPTFRVAAVRALVAIGSAAQPAFIEVLRADSSTVEKVVEEIGPNALPALTESLHEKDKHVRIRAMYNIGEIWKHQKLYGKYNRLAMELRAFEAVPALVKAVADEDKCARGCSTGASGNGFRCERGHTGPHQTTPARG